jgi:DNA-binding protein H-NS
MTIDLNSLSLSELKDLKGRVARAIASYDDRRRKEVLSELEEAARARGFSLAELTGLRSVRKRAPASVLYANPADPRQTWNGRGRKPGWYQAAIAAGAAPDSLKV